MSDNAETALMFLGLLGAGFVAYCILSVVTATILCRCLSKAEADPWPSEAFYAAYFAGESLPITGRDLYGDIAALMAGDVVEAAEQIARSAA